MNQLYLIAFITCASFFSSSPGFGATYSFSLEKEMHKIRIETEIHKKPCSVFNAVTDYDNLSRFYSNLEYSKVLKKYHDFVVVEQLFVAKIIGINVKQRATFRIKHTENKITMEQIEGDFVHYRSIWLIRPHKNNTIMTIDTEFKVNFLKNLFIKEASLEKKYTAFIKDMNQQVNSGRYEDCTQ